MGAATTHVGAGESGGKRVVNKRLGRYTVGAATTHAAEPAVKAVICHDGVIFMHVYQLDDAVKSGVMCGSGTTVSNVDANDVPGIGMTERDITVRKDAKRVGRCVVANKRSDPMCLKRQPGRADVPNGTRHESRMVIVVMGRLLLSRGVEGGNGMCERGVQKGM